MKKTIATTVMTIALLACSGLCRAVVLPSVPAESCSLRGTCFHDSNSNRLYDSGESCLAGITVELHRLVLRQGRFVRQDSSTTDSTGQYSFDGLMPGLYRVEETDPENATSTTPNMKILFLGFLMRSRSANFGDLLNGLQSRPLSVSITADADSIDPGESVQLEWSASNADAVSIDQGIGDVAPEDSCSVTPAATTTYTITAVQYDDGGEIAATATDSVTVVVYQPLPPLEAPSIVITVDNPQIIAGEATTIAWTAINATYVSLNQGLGSVPLAGSVSVTPRATTTYRFSLIGPGGFRSADTTITVLSSATPGDGSGGGTGETPGTTIPDEPDEPEVVSLHITMPASGAEVADCSSPMTLQVEARTADDTPIADEHISWSSNRDGQLGTGATLEVYLTHGEHTLTVQAGDLSAVTTVTVSCGEPVSMNPVTSPVPGSVYGGGEEVHFGTGAGPAAARFSLSAAAAGPDDPEYVWVSNIDGILGFGIFFIVNADDLTCGEHTISVCAVADLLPDYPEGSEIGSHPDVTGVSTLTIFTITVCDVVPEVLITSPAPGTRYTACSEEVHFKAESDPGYSFVWESNADGPISVPEGFDSDDFSVPAGSFSNGNHQITLTVIDGDGMVVRKIETSIYIACVKPRLVITSPMSGSRYNNCDEEIVLEGWALGADDTDLGDAIVWSSDLDGDLGTGATLSLNASDLSYGYHVISATITDDSGCTARAVISLNAHCETPFLIELVDFQAESGPDGVTVCWETAGELNTAGFHLSRAGRAAGQYQRLTDALVPARGAAVAGAAYCCTDEDARAGAGWYYLLEEVGTDGAITTYGPVKAE